MAHEKPARRLVDQSGRRSRTLYGKLNKSNAKYLLVRECAENDLIVRQCTFVHAAAYCHTHDAIQRCQFGALTPLSCIASMTICCSLHKSALTYKEIISNTFSNQSVLCICICLISCTEPETYAHVVLRDDRPVFVRHPVHYNSEEELLEEHGKIKFLNLSVIL